MSLRDGGLCGDALLAHPGLVRGEVGAGTFAFRRDDLVVMVIFGSRSAKLPSEIGELLLSSGTDPID